MRMMILGFLLLNVISFTPVVHASDLPPQPLPNDSAPPTPIENDVMHFSQLLPIYEKGQPTNEAMLTGSWLLIANATAAGCGSSTSDKYDRQGIKNGDGSIPTFKFAPEKVASLPGSDSPDHIFGVRLLNLGSNYRNQGPFKVDPNAPQFSQWAYNINGQSQTVYMAYSCRSLQNADSAIVCAIKLHIPDSDTNPYDRACAANQIGAIYVFAKQ